jgi:diguanylate cyclase (GGDEF)-like protein
MRTDQLTLPDVNITVIQEINNKAAPPGTLTGAERRRPGRKAEDLTGRRFAMLTVLERVQNRNSATVMDNDYLVTVNACGDDWYVICSVPTKIILNEKNEMELYIVLIACVAEILSAVLAIVLSVRMTRPVESYVSTLDEQAHIDRLTGILNKISFEEYTKSCLEHELPTVPHVLILVDLDNFKGVNDTLGHAYGDKVLANVGRILMETFSESDYLGRIGGDEFCVLMNTPAPKGRSYREFIEEKCQALCEQFHNNYTGDDGKYKVSASIGAACFPECGRDFAELYAMADKALYSSKERGKDTYTIAETEVKS